MMKSRSTGHRAEVTFVLDAAVGATAASVCGDFNGWSGSRHAMVRADDGSFSLTIALEAGRRYRFRYLLDGDRWENDWAADEYVPNDFGGDDSVVDLTALADELPPVASAPSLAPAAEGHSARPRTRAKPGEPTKRQPSKKVPANDAAPSAQPTKTVPSKQGAPKAQAAKNPPVAAQKTAAQKVPAKRGPAKKARG